VRDALAQLRQASEAGDLLAYGAADVAFHQSITSLSGNGTLTATLASLQMRARRYVVFTNLPGLNLQAEAGGHEAILRALEAGDPEALAVLVEQHIHSAGTRLIERMNTQLG
jgi:DNA-binding GntR family transcriptional regulator